jgi:formate hydrogenlyase subunit 4
VSEGLRAVLVLALGVAGILARLAWQAARTPVSDGTRLVAEFRVIRLAAILLAATGAVYIGFAVARAQTTGAALEIALAAGFITLAAVAMTRDPRQALAMLALGFVAHALLDIAHRPGFLPPEFAPRWYLIGCAVYDSAIAAICYWPALRR